MIQQSVQITFKDICAEEAKGRSKRDIDFLKHQVNLLILW